jgi:hypothetical protein
MVVHDAATRICGVIGMPHRINAQPRQALSHVINIARTHDFIFGSVMPSSHNQCILAYSLYIPLGFFKSCKAVSLYDFSRMLTLGKTACENSNQYN